jgi:hypothetical protein
MAAFRHSDKDAELLRRHAIKRQYRLKSQQQSIGPIFPSRPLIAE